MAKKVNARKTRVGKKIKGGTPLAKRRTPARARAAGVLGGEGNLPVQHALRTPEPKTFGNTNIAEALAAEPDIRVVGNGDTWRLLCKASSQVQGWMKSTKVLEIPGIGVCVQVTTQHGEQVAEALDFVPGATVVDDLAFPPGLKLVRIGAPPDPLPVPSESAGMLTGGLDDGDDPHPLGTV